MKHNVRLPDTQSSVINQELNLAHLPTILENSATMRELSGFQNAYILRKQSHSKLRRVVSAYVMNGSGVAYFLAAAHELCALCLNSACFSATYRDVKRTLRGVRFKKEFETLLIRLLEGLTAIICD